MQWTVKVKQRFCPKCKGTDLEDLDAEHPEWISDCELAVKAEYLKCKRCGHEFAIWTAYNLSCFTFLDEDEDGTDYIVEV